MILPCPLLLSFTFFPYTTLFRSVVVVDGLVDRTHGERIALLGLAQLAQVAHAALIGKVTVNVEPLPEALSNPIEPPCRDRKSTRLNSSHLVISYGVFCLNKKHKH